MADAQKKILIVDDDQFLRDMVVAAFEEAGFVVTPAADGEEAWDKIEAGYRPDVVFTGILMPRLTGFGLVEKMQAKPELSKIPVAIFSHRGRLEDRERAKELNANEFILQGVVPLAEIVRRIKLISGTAAAGYRVYLKRYHDDAEKLLELLDNQTGSDVANSKKESLFLELTPLQEKGEFKVRVVVNDGPIIGS